MKHLGETEWMGNFSLPEDPDREVHGLLRVQEHRAVLILSGQLLPQKSGRLSIIHGGLLSDQPFVTLFDAVITQPLEPGVFDSSSIDAHGQILEVRWLVYGAWLTEERRVTHASVHLSGLDAWAQAPIASLESFPRHSEVQKAPDNIEAPLSGKLPGTVRLTFTGERKFEAHRQSVVRRTQLDWIGTEAMPLEDVTEHFAVSLRTFFSLMRMDRCVIDQYRVRIAGGPDQSLRVDGWMVEDPIGDQRHDGTAAQRNESGVRPIATWLEKSPGLGRAPATTARVLARDNKFSPVDFTTMVMVMEGLHRVLHPDKRGELSDEQIEKARAAIDQAKTDRKIDGPTKTILVQRVCNDQLREPTLAQRIRHFQCEVQPLVQMICGTAPDAERDWREKVKTLRNDYAHGLDQHTEMLETIVLTSSLTVLVAARCLMEADYSAEELAKSLPSTNEGRNLEHWGKTLMPDLYDWENRNVAEDQEETLTDGSPKTHWRRALLILATCRRIVTSRLQFGRRGISNSLD